MAGLIPFNRKNSELKPHGFEDFYNMLDDFFNESWSSGRSLLTDTFKLDMRDNGNQYMIEAELPGIKKEEVSLDLNDGKLTISVKREENIEKNEKNYIHKERRYGSMQRSIYLSDASNDGITAKLEDGLLKITVPKETKIDNSRRIQID
ncbi:MAG: Hsp20/alpha crystallin family protein [Eubacteriales bacterium]